MFSNGLATFQPVDMFLHRQTTGETEFLRIETEQGKVLEMTSKHVMFQVDCDSSPSSWRLNDMKSLFAGLFLVLSVVCNLRILLICVWPIFPSFFFNTVVRPSSVTMLVRNRLKLCCVCDI